MLSVRIIKSDVIVNAGHIAKKLKQCGG